MKVWAKPGLETLNVSMTMNNNVLNSVIVTANEVNTPTETATAVESNTTDTSINNENIGAESIEKNEQEIASESSEAPTSEDVKTSITSNEKAITTEASMTEGKSEKEEPSPLTKEESCTTPEPDNKGASSAETDGMSPPSAEAETNNIFSEEEILLGEKIEQEDQIFEQVGSIGGGCPDALIEQELDPDVVAMIFGS